MTMLNPTRGRSALVVALLGILTLVMAACSGSVPTSSTPVGSGDNLNKTLQIAQQKVNDNHLDDSGFAHLTWDTVTHALSVTLNLSGLPPGSTHPAHIHLGNCSMMGNIQYPLSNVVADRNGNYIGTTIIQNVMNGIPASGWYINVHHGPGLATPNQMAPISCGNIVNPSAKPDHVEVLHIQLNPIFINQFTNVNKVASTVPGNGDVNPYGVAVVQQSTGKLVKGNVLVSNFNNSANMQGTGTTIVQIAPDGQQTVFAQLAANSCPDGIGLTTALVELKRGWVIVGSLPAADGKFANVKPGCLIVLNNHGQTVATWKGHSINGPWDAVAQENHDGSEAALFITNTLNGVVPASNNVVNQGNVVRLNLHIPEQNQSAPWVTSIKVIGTGFAEKTDPAALVIGPTGLGLGSNGVLYVADTINNRIIAIKDALTRDTTANANNHVLTANGSLNAELGLTIAPNGDILTVNGGDGNLIEVTPTGTQIAIKQISTMGTPPGAGCLFGLANTPDSKGIYFVDDCTNQLNLFH